MDIPPKDVSTAVIHLYRGELGRMTAYRARLDTTTNWAVGTTAALISFAIGQSQTPHTAFLLVVLFNLVFLWMEGRRYRFYELVRRRVRLLERGFYGDVLGGGGKPGWEVELRASLDTLEPPLGRLHAMAVRLRRNYVWLFGTAYVGWLLKLRLDGASLRQGAAVGSVPGAVVLGATLVLLLTLVGIAFIYPSKDEE